MNRKSEGPEEMSRRLLADGAEAERLVNQYGGIIEVTSKMTWGVPKSLLPEPKERIKQAIVVYLLCLHAQGMLDKNNFELLKVGYTQLASFIDDAEAKAAVTAMAAFNAGEPSDVSSPSVKAAIERFRQIIEEKKLLAVEFDEIVKKNSISSPEA